MDGRVIKLITHAIYPKLIISIHTKSLVPLLIAKLGHHFIIFGQLRIKKHGIIINITNDTLALWPGYCIYTGAFSPITLDQTILSKKSKFAKT